jgi:DNA-binding IscR family transcriptional regulator
MPSQGSSSKSPILLRDKRLVLSTVNVLQPVDGKTLREGLAAQLNKNDVEQILTMLVKEQLVISLPGGSYSVTNSGRRVSRSRILTKARDVGRLLYLVERSKGGGVGP